MLKTSVRVVLVHRVFQRVTHHTPQQHDHHTTRRQTQRGTETVREDREEDKTTEERREKINFQCGGAWPFFVDEALLLVHSVCARDLSLSDSVKHDSSLISFSASWKVNNVLISANCLFYAVIFSFLFFLMQLQFRKFSELFSYAATVFPFQELSLHKYSVEGYHHRGSSCLLGCQDSL